MAVTITVTDKGRAALVNAAKNGTAPVTIAAAGLSGSAVAPSPSAVNLPGEFKRIATLSGDVVAADTIHLIVRDESTDVFTVRSIGLYLADGTLFAIYGQANPILEKSAQAMMLLAVDVKFADISAAAITFGNANFLNPPATTETQGVIELATVAEAQAGIDALRALTPASARAAIMGWLQAQDGAGSGLDADLLDGRDGGYYENIPARLGFWPVQQGTGSGQTPNVIKIGWSQNSRLKATVDVTDQGNFVFDSHIADVWRAANDGAGSGLDADLLDGVQGSNYARTDLAGGVAFAGGVTAPYLGSSGDINAGGLITGGSLRIGNGATNGVNGLYPGTGDGATLTTYNLALAVHWGLGLRTYDGTVNGVYDARQGRWNVRTSYQVNGVDVWHGSNDGAGSGLDADLFQGRDPSYYTNIPARLGFQPVQQGTGIGQLAANVIRIGWGTNSRVRVTVDNTDAGNMVFDGHIADVWRSSNDGAGSGLDADLLDGRDSTYYTNVAGHLGYTPVRQGGGVNQLSNVIKIGWTGARLSATVDVTDQGPFVFDNHIANVWRSSNDGAGSGLDADLLDGIDGSKYARLDLGGGAAFAGGVTAPYLGSSGDAIVAGTVTGAAVRVSSGAQQNGLWGGVGDGASFTNYNLTMAVHWGLGLRTYDGSVNGVYDAREGRWNVRASYQVNGVNVWHGANDGSGSGLDADLLDGSDGSFYANIPARLGFWPVRQGGGANQTANTVYIGWSNASRLRAQVDSSDLGAFVFDAHIADVWRSANDGSGSGLDADLLDGLDGSAYLRDIGNSLEQTGYMKLSNGWILQWGWSAALTNRANNTVNFPTTFPNAVLAMWCSLGTGIGIGDSNFSIGAQPLNNSQARIAIATSNGGTIGCYWFALGK